MAKDAKYTEQMPFVGTRDQYELVEATEHQLRDSKAAVVRAGLNLLFDLDWTERASPEDRDAKIRRALDIVRNPSAYRVTKIATEAEPPAVA